ncbi:MAG TPA: hypothetical protein DCS74_04075, partial [Veillonellaceae bacterium]|nr:hypothetical protein [Veillonellaceae bacterium]
VYTYSMNNTYILIKIFFYALYLFFTNLFSVIIKPDLNNCFIKNERSARKESVALKSKQIYAPRHCFTVIKSE